jgi:hypothetical protein
MPQLREYARQLAKLVVLSVCIDLRLVVAAAARLDQQKMKRKESACFGFFTHSTNNEFS